MRWVLSMGVAALGSSMVIGACDGTTTTAFNDGGAGGSDVGGQGAHAGGDGGSTSDGGGGTITTGGAGGEGGEGGAAGGGGEGGTPCMNAGDCTSSADCGGSACVEITPCGFRVCEKTPPEATECIHTFDECCTSADCVAGGCYQWPWGANCGGIQPVPHNQCVEDACSVPSDCGSNPGSGLAWQCAPPGTFGNPKNACVLSNCTTDADCTAEAGGICAPVQTACCSAPVALYCVYPSNGCRSPQDCNGNTHCDFDGQGASCIPGPAICPA